MPEASRPVEPQGDRVDAPLEQHRAAHPRHAAVAIEARQHPGAVARRQVPLVLCDLPGLFLRLQNTLFFECVHLDHVGFERIQLRLLSLGCDLANQLSVALVLFDHLQRCRIDGIQA